ncbi:MAG: NHL repeat-containing protein [Thermoanaerobaculia bacterium]
MSARVVAAMLLCLASAADAAMQVEVVRTIAHPADVSSRAATLVGWLIGKPETTLFERPYAVAWDGDALLVADPGAHRVLRIEGNRVSRTAEDALEEPVGVTSCGSGVVVTDSVRGEVILFDRNLRKSRVLASGIAHPTGVVCHGDEVIFVATGEHRLVIVNAATGVTRMMGGRGEGPVEFNFPVALAISGSSLWVGDTLNFRVQQIDLQTGLLQSELGGLGDGAGDTPRIKGVAIDAGGRLWISDAHLDRLSVFDPSGRLVAIIGGPGGEAGQFSFPAGVAVAADGRIAVADSLNRRIQVLRVDEGAQ